ncbi:MAG: hypothetical protein HC900_11205 [Methylacidiphilales bacterium]|nr:hypothetical protein [Candidatus Methylacidiphilales bacterium]
MAPGTGTMPPAGSSPLARGTRDRRHRQYPYLMAPPVYVGFARRSFAFGLACILAYLLGTEVQAEQHNAQQQARDCDDADHEFTRAGKRHARGPRR